MKCEEYQELFTDWLDDQLPADKRAKLEQHITECPACREELAVIQHTWDIMGEFKAPEPSAAMKVNFQAMLDDYKQTIQEKQNVWTSLRERFAGLWQVQPKLSLSYSLMIVLICF